MADKHPVHRVFDQAAAKRRIFDTTDGHLRRAADWREFVGAPSGGFETDHEHEQFVFKTLQQIVNETRATQMQLIHERAASERSTVNEALDVLHETVKPVHIETPDKPDFETAIFSDYVALMNPRDDLNTVEFAQIPKRIPRNNGPLIAEPSEDQVKQFAPLSGLDLTDAETRVGAIAAFKGEKARADAAADSAYGSKDLVELPDGSYAHVTDDATRQLGLLDGLRADCDNDHLMMIDTLMNKLMVEPNEELRDIGMVHLDDMKGHAESFAEAIAISLDTERAAAYGEEFGQTPLEDASACFDQFMLSSWLLLRNMKHMKSPDLKKLEPKDAIALAKEVRDISTTLMSVAFFKATKDMEDGADKILYYQRAFGLFDTLNREAGDRDRAN